MKLTLMLAIFWFTINSANAQKLTLNELTSTFEQPNIQKLGDFLKGKGFEYFRKDVFANGRDTSRTYRPIDRSQKAFFEYKTYKSSKSNTLYNYQIKYTIFYERDFTPFEALLVREKYTKEDGQSSYTNGKYTVDLEVIKVTEHAKAYRVSITNMQLGVIILDIMLDTTLNKN